VTLGFDRSAYDYYLTQPRFTTPADSFVYAFSAEETKTSVAYNTAVEVSLGPSIQSSLVAGVDHWNYHQGGFYSGNTSSTSGTFTAPTFGYRNEYTNTGYFVQEQVGFRNALFVTAGVRAEDNQNFGKDFGLAWAPRVGASYVRALGDVVVKARLSYGKAIRPPAPGYARTIITSSYEQLGNINLGPEEQFGSDGGLEFYFGRRGSLEATYYHQTAVDLIDQVFLGNSPVYTFQYQNVGKIKNTGWEFQGHLNAGRFSLNATYSYTNSVVQTLSPTYGGDLLPGDHLRHIPKHTGGVTLGYRLGRTALDLGMTYVGPWTEYDYGALFGYFYGGQPFRGSLRDYWITYPSFAKFNFAVSQTVTDRFSVFLRSDNLFNNDVSEPVNLYPNLGRVTMIGLQMR